MTIFGFPEKRTVDSAARYFQIQNFIANPDANIDLSHQLALVGVQVP